MLSRLARAAERAGDALLAGRLAPWLLAAGYVAYGLRAVLRDRFLDDEGLLTWIFAAWLRGDPLPTLFFQKCKPVTAALYALPSLGGPRAVLVAHVLVAAAAIPLLARVARARGQRWPNLPAIALALSPLYLVGGPAGISNVDGVVGGVVFLHLYMGAERRLAAGVLLGALPWVRFELAVLVVVFVAYDLLVERRRALLAGALVFPLAYALAGALYHHDPLWWIHYPPSLGGAVPGNPVWDAIHVSPSVAVNALAAVTPLAALALLAPVRRLAGAERAVLAYALANWALILLLPVWRIFNFGYSPRYALQSLPFAALMVGRAVEALAEARARAGETALLVGALAAAWLAARGDGGTAALWVVLGYAAIVLLARASFARGAAVAALALAAAGPLLLHGETQVGREGKTPWLDGVAGWLRAHRGARPIYTNANLLSTALGGDAEVRFLVGTDQWYELTHLANPHNGQRAALERLLRRSFYGRAVLPSELAPASLPPDALLVLVDDVRLPLAMPPTVWAGRTRTLADFHGCTIAELAP